MRVGILARFTVNRRQARDAFCVAGHEVVFSYARSVQGSVRPQLETKRFSRFSFG
jgi:hypothetical protein